MDRLGQIFKKQTLLSELSKTHLVVAVIQSSWEDVFGKLAKHLRFSSYKKGVLTIVSDNPMWINEIDFYKTDLIKKMNEKITAELGHKKAVFQLKISFEKAGKKAAEPSVKKPEKMDLKSLIEHENKMKKENGFKLCEKCSSMYTKETYCFFCLQDS